MDFKKYLNESEKFVSASFIKSDEQEELLKGAIEHFLLATEKLDILKKHKYYGKPLSNNFKVRKPLKRGENETFKYDSDESEPNLHAVIGICTEAGELLQAMYEHKWKNKPFDEVNAKEEIGDIFWYMAILFRGFKWNINAIWERNTEKLSKRYGKSFSSERAINRNLKEERQILEKKETRKSIFKRLFGKINLNF